MALKIRSFSAITHVLIYVLAGVEAFINKDTFSFANGIGLVILIFAYIMLFMVIKTLGGIWTLKLFIYLTILLLNLDYIKLQNTQITSKHHS